MAHNMIPSYPGRKVFLTHSSGTGYNPCTKGRVGRSAKQLRTGALVPVCCKDRGVEAQACTLAVRSSVAVCLVLSKLAKLNLFPSEHSEGGEVWCSHKYPRLRNPCFWHTRHFDS